MGWAMDLFFEDFTASDSLKQQAKVKKDQAADLTKRAKIVKGRETESELSKRLAKTRSDITTLGST